MPGGDGSSCRRRVLSVFLLVLSLFCAQSLAANLLTTALFESNLDPTQEVPPSTISAHSGTAKLQFDLKTKYLAWIVDHTVWDSTGAQLHGPAAPGATAPVLIDLGDPTSPINGGTTLNADQEKSLMEGLLYFNILSPTFPEGDIRGQIIRSKSSYSSTLEGKAMIPPITSNATGTAQFTYDHTKRTLTFTITHNVTAPLGVFLHGPAQPEQVANSTFKFPRAQSPIQGSFTFNTSDEAMLFEDLLYINVTSQTHPYGELRGQVIYLEEGDEDFSSGWTWWKVVLVLFGITSGVVLIGGSAYYGHRYWKKRKEFKEQTKQLADPLLQ